MRLGPSYWAVSGLAVLTAIAVGGLRAPRDPQAAAAAAACDSDQRAGKQDPDTHTDILTIQATSGPEGTMWGSAAHSCTDPAAPVSPVAVVVMPLDLDPEIGGAAGPGAASSTRAVGDRMLNQRGSVTTGGLAGGGPIAAGGVTSRLSVAARGSMVASAGPAGRGSIAAGLKAASEPLPSAPTLPPGIVPSYLTTALLGLALCMYTGTEVCTCWVVFLMHTAPGSCQCDIGPT